MSRKFDSFQDPHTLHVEPAEFILRPVDDWIEARRTELRHITKRCPKFHFRKDRGGPAEILPQPQTAQQPAEEEMVTPRHPDHPTYIEERSPWETTTVEESPPWNIEGSPPWSKTERPPSYRGDRGGKQWLERERFEAKLSWQHRPSSRDMFHRERGQKAQK